MYKQSDYMCIVMYMHDFLPIRPKWHVYNWARKFCIRSHGYVDFNLTVALTPFNVQETMIMTSVALTAHNRICNLYVRVAVANLMSLFAQNKPHKNTYRNLNTCIVWFRCKLLGEQLHVDLRSSGWSCGVNTLWRHSVIRVYTGVFFYSAKQLFCYY